MAFVKSDNFHTGEKFAWYTDHAESNGILFSTNPLIYVLIKNEIKVVALK